MTNDNRPLTGKVLADVLKELAIVDAMAFSLRESLKPLSDEEIAAGAESLDADQIGEELEKISQIVTTIALRHLRAESSEWYVAIDRIEE